jgi:hypothetical protein
MRRDGAYVYLVRQANVVFLFATHDAARRKQAQVSGAG